MLNEIIQKTQEKITENETNLKTEEQDIITEEIISKDIMAKTQKKKGLKIPEENESYNQEELDDYVNRTFHKFFFIPFNFPSRVIRRIFEKICKKQFNELGLDDLYIIRELLSEKDFLQVARDEAKYIIALSNYLKPKQTEGNIVHYCLTYGSYEVCLFENAPVTLNHVQRNLQRLFKNNGISFKNEANLSRELVNFEKLELQIEKTGMETLIQMRKLKDEVKQKEEFFLRELDNKEKYRSIYHQLTDKLDIIINDIFERKEMARIISLNDPYL